MKKISALAVTAVVALGISATSCDSNKTMSTANLKTDVDSVSYIMGKGNGMNFKKGVESWPAKINMDAYLAGFMAAAKGESDSTFLGKDLQAADAYVQEFFKKAQEKASEEAKKVGDEFLAKNKTADGVITTESGLQYKVITEGTGVKPAAEDTVEVNYTGKLLDGTVFDSNEKMGKPAKFPLMGVIKGFSEALMLMPAGSKYTLWIPSDLAYGPQSPSQLIKPNSTLQFDLELVNVVKAKK